jgi:hypothetical protein
LYFFLLIAVRSYVDLLQWNRPILQYRNCKPRFVKQLFFIFSIDPRLVFFSFSEICFEQNDEEVSELTMETFSCSSTSRTRKRKKSSNDDSQNAPESGTFHVPSRAAAYQIHSTSRPVSNQNQNSVWPELADAPAQYPAIFFRAYNSFEKSEFLELLRRYCVPDIVFVGQAMNEMVYFNSPQYFELHGPETVASFWENLFLAAPDYTFRLKKATHIPRENNCLTIVCDYVFSATMLYRLNTLATVKHKRVAFTTEFTAPEEEQPTPQDNIPSEYNEDNNVGINNAIGGSNKSGGSGGSGGESGGSAGVGCGACNSTRATGTTSSGSVVKLIIEEIPESDGTLTDEKPLGSGTPRVRRKVSEMGKCKSADTVGSRSGSGSGSKEGSGGDGADGADGGACTTVPTVGSTDVTVGNDTFQVDVRQAPRTVFTMYNGTITYEINSENIIHEIVFRYSESVAPSTAT